MDFFIKIKKKENSTNGKWAIEAAAHISHSKRGCLLCETWSNAGETADE